MKKSFLAIAVFTAGLALTTGANALTLPTVDTTGTTSGSVTSVTTKSLDYFAHGVLPPETEIVFTYTSKSIGSGILTSGGSFGSTSTAATSFGSKKTSSVFPIVATAYLNAGTNSPKGEIVIENTTSTAESFKAFFLSLITSGKGRAATISYVISSIPLPASFSLFLTGIVAMLGFGAARKNGRA